MKVGLQRRVCIAVFFESIMESLAAPEPFSLQITNQVSDHHGVCGRGLTDKAKERDSGNCVGRTELIGVIKEAHIDRNPLAAVGGSGVDV